MNDGASPIATRGDANRRQKRIVTVGTGQLNCVLDQLSAHYPEKHRGFALIRQRVNAPVFTMSYSTRVYTHIWTLDELLPILASVERMIPGTAGLVAEAIAAPGEWLSVMVGRYIEDEDQQRLRRISIAGLMAVAANS